MKDRKAKGKGPEPLNEIQGLPEKIGNHIKELRKAKGFTSAELFSYEHGFNRSQYIAYESGKSDLRITSLARLCNAFDITMEEFFAGMR